MILNGVIKMGMKKAFMEVMYSTYIISMLAFFMFILLESVANNNNITALLAVFGFGIVLLGSNYIDEKFKIEVI